LAQVAVDFLKMPEARRIELSQRCMNYARQNLSIERMVDGMVETIESVVRARTA
jgi:hypothetical protein